MDCMTGVLAGWWEDTLEALFKQRWRLAGLLDAYKGQSIVVASKDNLMMYKSVHEEAA